MARDYLKQPFRPESIWNLPLGAGAQFVGPPILTPPSQQGFFEDPDILVLRPTAPMTDVYYNGDGWTGGSRCAPQGGIIFTAPIPTDFVIPGATPSNTPNNAMACLLPDGKTLIQGQPFTRCVAGQAPTCQFSDAPGVEDLYGYGVSGYHGGSHLSSIGGCIRLGELVPGGRVPHAIQLGLYGAENYWSGGSGFRWPALTADANYQAAFPQGYHGTHPELTIGSLLAIPPSVKVADLNLETPPAKILFTCLQDYGAYLVDDAAWSAINISTEISPDGRVTQEFLANWGFPMTQFTLNNPWSRDTLKLMAVLGVVNNWDYTTWQMVAASAGAQGAGGGAPRQPWADQQVTPPPTSGISPLLLGAAAVIGIGAVVGGVILTQPKR